MTIDKIVAEFKQTLEKMKTYVGLIQNMVGNNENYTINGIKHDSLPKLLLDAEVSRNNILANETQINNILIDAKNVIFDAYNTNPSKTVYNVVKNTAQACYDAINNAPIGAHVEFIAQG